MGVGAYIGFLLIFLLVILVTVIFFPRWKRKRMKLWRVIGTLLLLIICSSILLFTLEDYFYFKSDVVSDLNKLDITLQDQFKIKDNEIVGFTDYNRITTVIISKEDKDRITKKIKDSKNIKDISFGDFTSDRVRLTQKADSIYNYRLKNASSIEYIRESFQKEEAYAACITSITIPKDGNELVIFVVE